MSGTAGPVGEAYERDLALELLVRAILAQHLPQQDVGEAKQVERIEAIQRQSTQSSGRRTTTVDLVATVQDGGRWWFEVTGRKTNARGKLSDEVRKMWLGFLDRHQSGEEQPADRYVFVAPQIVPGDEEFAREEIRRSATGRAEAERFLSLLECQDFQSDDGSLRDLLICPPLILTRREIDSLLKKLGEFLDPLDNRRFPLIQIADLRRRLELDGLLPNLFPNSDDAATQATKWQIQRSDLLDALDRKLESGNVLVLGEAGIGKTHLVSAWEQRRNDAAPRSVVRADASRFLKVDDAAGLRRRLQSYWSHGGKIFILDGLDEIWNPADAKTALDFVKAAAGDCSRLRLVVATRTSEARWIRSPLLPAWQELRVPHLSLKDLDRIRRSLGEDLLDPLFEDDRVVLRELVRNPFRLVLLVRLLGDSAPRVWEKLDTVTTETEFLCEYWELRVRADDRLTTLDTEGVVLSLAARLVSEERDAVRTRELSLDPKRVERGRSLGVLDDFEGELRFASRVFRDFVTALAFRERVDDVDGFEWLRRSPDEPSRFPVLRHWLGIEAWLGTRDGDRGRYLEETWMRMVRDLPEPLAVDAAEILAGLLDSDLAGRFVGFTEQLDAPLRKSCRGWVLVERTRQLRQRSRVDLPVEVALASAMAKIDAELPFTETVLFVEAAVAAIEEAQCSDLTDVTRSLFDRIASEPALQGHAKWWLLSRLLVPLIRCHREDQDTLRLTLERLDLTDPYFAQSLLDALPNLAALDPELAVLFWRNCVLCHLGGGNRDAVFWSAGHQVSRLLELAPGPMTEAILNLFNQEALRRDSEQEQSRRRIRSHLQDGGLEIEPDQARASAEAEVLDRDILQWLGDVTQSWTNESIDRFPTHGSRGQLLTILLNGSASHLKNKELDADAVRRISEKMLPIIERLKGDENPALLSAAGPVLRELVDTLEHRSRALTAAEDLLARGILQPVSSLRHCRLEKARSLGEIAFRQAGHFSISPVERGRAKGLPETSEWLDMLDQHEGLNQTTAAYKELRMDRIRLHVIGADRRGAFQPTQELLDLVGRLETIWKRLVLVQDAALRQTLERELAGAAEGLAGRYENLPDEHRCWLDRFLLKHAALAAPLEEENGDLESDLSLVSSGVDARCSRALLAITKARTLTDAEITALTRLAAYPTPDVRVEVARGLVSLNANHPDLLWDLASRFANQERGHSGSAVLLWLIPSMEPVIRASPTRGVSFLKNIWSRRMDLLRVGHLGCPDDTALAQLIDLAVRTDEVTAITFVERLLRELDDSVTCEAVARGASQALERTIPGTCAEECRRAGQIVSSVLRSAYEGLRRTGEIRDPFNQSVLDIVTALVHILEGHPPRPGGLDQAEVKRRLQRIPKEVWTALCADRPPDLGPNVGNMLLRLGRDVAALDADPSLALRLAELATLREGHDLLNLQGSQPPCYTANLVVEVIEKTWHKKLDEAKHRRIFRILNAFSRYQLDSIRALRERLVRSAHSE